MVGFIYHKLHNFMGYQRVVGEVQGSKVLAMVVHKGNEKV